MFINKYSDYEPLDCCNRLGYSQAVIKSFKHKGLEDFFYDGSKKGIQPKHDPKLSDILDRLDAAKVVTDMNFQDLIYIS